MKRKALITVLALLVSVSLAAGTSFAQGKDAGKKTAPPVASSKQRTELIDINSASKQELMTLP